MKGPERLTRLVEPVVEGLGYELVGLEFDARARIFRVYIDQPGGVTLDDCTRVSHQLSGMMDVENPIPGEYQLEISSPGMDRPLFTVEHFRRFSGSLIRLQLVRAIEGRRRFKGRLGAVEGDLILLQEDGVDYRIPFESIEKARVVPEFEQKNRKGRDR
ncbi:MAG: ribosome maturation factor RimP [Methylococcaceae bacterium]|nr:ribosome maturation factor RimP [Methylococcaceae bacterium]